MYQFNKTIKIIIRCLKDFILKPVRNTGFIHRYVLYEQKSASIVKTLFYTGVLYISSSIRKLKCVLTRKYELDYAEIFITDRCTLRCRDCSILIPYLEKQQDFDMNTLIKDLEAFLMCFDKIHKIGILGGEAMLHKNFAEILEYVQNHEKVGSIRIVTNGTYLPNENIINAIKSCSKVHVNISGYKNLKSGKRESLEKLLSESEIDFSAYESQLWNDLGSPLSQKEKNSRNLKKKFKLCWMKKCNEIVDGKFYLCGRSAFLPRVREMDYDDNDYIDIRDIKNPIEGRNKLSRIFKKKSLSACAYCNGTCDSPRVEPAIQAEKKI